MKREFEISQSFIKQVGRLAIRWGDIEGLTRTLEMMRGRTQQFSAKSSSELRAAYKAEWWPFEKRMKSVFPPRSSITHGILALKRVRDFVMHGAWFGVGVAGTVEEAIVHVDASATLYSQMDFQSRKRMQVIIPKSGMAENKDSQLSPAILKQDGLKRACAQLDGYIYDFRLFRTIFQVKDGAKVEFTVSGPNAGSTGESQSKSDWGTPRSIESSVFCNPSDVIGHDESVELAFGEFCCSFSMLDVIIRTLELMRRDRPGHFKGWSEKYAESWYLESTRQLTARINFILGKDSNITKKLVEIVKFRNFVYHNPISMLGGDHDDANMAVFLHKDLVALRDARPRPDEEKNQIRPVPAWAIRLLPGTGYVPARELESKSEEIRQLQNDLIHLVEQAHKR